MVDLGNYPRQLRISGDDSRDGDNSLMAAFPMASTITAWICRITLRRYARSITIPARVAVFQYIFIQRERSGTPGTASRRSFYGPGDVELRSCAVEGRPAFGNPKSLQFRLESFNTFNHAQFFGAAAVDGGIDDNLFGQVGATRRLPG